MSVTVSDLLKLPSLRQATVIGGHRGLSRIVSSISVLESTDPDVLVENVFPAGEFYGSEIVITGFLNCLDDIDCQCANIQRLAEGGEVGLILFYVGVYLPYVDQRLIDLADQLDFVLVQMPWGQKELRYGEVISDVIECIYHDRNRGESIVYDILTRVSSLPQPQRTISTVLKMLSDLLSASAILTDGFLQVLNLAALAPKPGTHAERASVRPAPIHQTGGEHDLPLPAQRPHLSRLHPAGRGIAHGALSHQGGAAPVPNPPRAMRGRHPAQLEHLGTAARRHRDPRADPSDLAGRAHQNAPPGRPVPHPHHCHRGDVDS